MDELDDIEAEKKPNPLYFITFKREEDYNSVYNKFPHSYIIHLIKNCFKKTDTFYINKAPNPEDVVWKNLEFNKEYKFFKTQGLILFLSFRHILVSFVIQIIGEILDSFFEEYIVYLFVINMIISFLLGKLDDNFSEHINEKLNDLFKCWSYSDIRFYSILYQTIFKFINRGIFPLLTYLLFNAFTKLIFKEEGINDFDDLVSKMFIIIEMDGFGFPLIDWLFNVIPRIKDLYNSQETIMSPENIEKEISDLVDNAKGLSRNELEEAYEKEKFDLEDNYSDTLSIYWITMFYLPIYPFGVIQTFLNLLFKYIIEKNLLLNIYKRPDYANPRFGFLCLNYYNFGFSLFFLGNLIFFKNNNNKKYFGVGYIIIMLILATPVFYYLAKLIMHFTNNCSCFFKSKEEKSSDKELSPITDYRLFNPYNQKENIINVFMNYKDEKKRKILEEQQIQELKSKLDLMKNYELYKLQEKFRTPKFMSFENKFLENSLFERSEYYYPADKNKDKLYSLLMYFGFLPYLEIGNILKPEVKQFSFIKPKSIRSDSLRKLSMQENLSNCNSGCFTLYLNDNKLRMAYVDEEKNVKIFDVFERKVLKEIIDSNHDEKKIICIKYFSYKDIQYLITIALDNTMVIYDLTENNSKIIKEYNIGDNFTKDSKHNIFSLSSVNHNEKNNNTVWIVTSYFYDKYFKIYDFNYLLNNSQKCEIKNNISLISELAKNEYKIIDNRDEYIISLETSFINEKNTYICVRTPKSINLFLNDLFIKKIIDTNGDVYINFKIKPLNLTEKTYYIIVTMIQKDLSEYSVKIFDIFTENKKNQEELSKIKPNDICEFKVRLNEKKEGDRIRYLENIHNYEKYNIGNILLWKEDYLIIGTPFNYIHILDYKKYKNNKNDEYNEPVGTINNEEKGGNKDDKEENLSDIITYEISEKIEDPIYGSSFIMRDNKGKIQYIRTAIQKDKLNYQINEPPSQHFNDFPNEVKLERIKHSAFFYLSYCLTNFFLPLIAGICGSYIKYSFKEAIYEAALSFYLFFIIIGFFIKFFNCDDPEKIDEIVSSVKTNKKIRIGIYVFFGMKAFMLCFVVFYFCQKIKSLAIFIGMLNAIYLAHFIFNFIVYKFQITYLLKIYLLEFLFYQISRFCIILLFTISIFTNVEYIEVYIYGVILCIILVYMFYINYYNTLKKVIVYESLLQAMFNFPYEWTKLFCCCCKKYEKLLVYIDSNGLRVLSD